MSIPEGVTAQTTARCNKCCQDVTLDLEQMSVDRIGFPRPGSPTEYRANYLGFHTCASESGACQHGDLQALFTLSHVLNSVRCRWCGLQWHVGKAISAE
jgi:hypothetical protein